MRYGSDLHSPINDKFERGCNNRSDQRLWKTNHNENPGRCQEKDSFAGHRHLNRELTEYAKSTYSIKIMKIPSTKDLGFGCQVSGVSAVAGRERPV
jgi:hypothetical protein